MVDSDSGASSGAAEGNKNSAPIGCLPFILGGLAAIFGALVAGVLATWAILSDNISLEINFFVDTSPPPPASWEEPAVLAVTLAGACLCGWFVFKRAENAPWMRLSRVLRISCVVGV